MSVYDEVKNYKDSVDYNWNRLGACMDSVDASKIREEILEKTVALYNEHPESKTVWIAIADAINRGAIEANKLRGCIGAEATRNIEDAKAQAHEKYDKSVHKKS